MNKILYSIITLFILSLSCNAQIIQDEFVNSTLDKNVLEKPLAHTKYNYQDTTKIPIRMRINKDILSENDVEEGQKITFTIINDVIYKRKIIIPKNTIVSANIETIIKSGMNGIPASIIFGNFQIPNIDQNKIDYTYERFGQDRSLWVFPLKWALTILPPTGSFTNFIKGGHAKLKTNKIITIYYRPNWI